MLGESMTKPIRVVEEWMDRLKRIKAVKLPGDAPSVRDPKVICVSDETFLKDPRKYMKLVKNDTQVLVQKQGVPDTVIGVGEHVFELSEDMIEG